MPEESKKNSQKGKNDPKEQRRRRQGRQPAGPVEKKPEKQQERQIEKKSNEPPKPAYEPPGPEFYKNLKRETDEILKITEEANTKYKKKEIQSNWAKYEMPVESYEEIDEQENMGADYEKLIQAPATTGGHFQFKHEKSWNTDIEPSLYDKYFTIDMDVLSLAVSTIPFYERNSIEQTNFNENDIVTMNHRATKFKQKYYNDKKYNTPELEAQEKLLKSLSSHSNNENSELMEEENNELCTIDDNALNKNNILKRDNSNTSKDEGMVKKELDLETEKVISVSSFTQEKRNIETKQADNIKFTPDVITKTLSNSDLEDETLLFEHDKISENAEPNKKSNIVLTEVEPPKENKVINKIEPSVNKELTITKETPKNPVIESPEDLEKWLDDFLES